MPWCCKKADTMIAPSWISPGKCNGSRPCRAYWEVQGKLETLCCVGKDVFSCLGSSRWAPSGNQHGEVKAWVVLMQTAAWRWPAFVWKGQKAGGEAMGRKKGNSTSERSLQWAATCNIEQQGKGATSKDSCARAGSLGSLIGGMLAVWWQLAMITHLSWGRRRVINGRVINGVQSCQATSFARMRA